MEDALRFGRFSNLIHLGSFYKFNFFPLRASDFHRREFARRRYAHAAVFGSSEIEFPVASAEDIVLSKLPGNGLVVKCPSSSGTTFWA